MTRQVWITGMGLVAASGCGGGDWVAGLDQVDTGFTAWPSELVAPGPSARLGLAQGFPAHLYFSERQMRLLDRSMVMGTCAAGLALQDAGLEKDLGGVDKDAVATLFGTVRCEQPSSHRFSQPLFMGKPRSLNPAQFPLIARNVACGQIAITFGLRGPSSMLASGPLSSLQAIARGADLIRRGQATMALVGGIESLAHFSINHSRHLYGEALNGEAPEFFGAGAGQLIAADGSAMLVLEEAAHAKARGVRGYAQVDACMGGHLGDDRTAMGAVRGLEAFLSRSGLAAAQAWRALSLVSGSQSGYAGGHDVLEQQWLRAMYERHDHAVPVTAVRSHVGEAESVASAAQVQLAAQALYSNRALSTRHVASQVALGLAPVQPGQALGRGPALVAGLDSAYRYVWMTLSRVQEPSHE